MCEVSTNLLAGVCVCWVERELAAIQSDFSRHDRRSERDVNMFPFERSSSRT